MPDLHPPGRRRWWTWPPTSACPIPPSTRSGTAQPHAAPELLDRFVYGLPELHRDRAARCPSDRRARVLSRPRRCWPSAPLVRAGVLAVPGDGTPDVRARPLAPALIVDAASGVSGAGRAPKDNLHFGAVDEDFVAYGLLDHRHTAEMEQGLGAPVLFTPHLAPMVRGILATCYARPAGTGPDGHPAALTTADALDILHHAYDDEPFVVVTDGSPSTKATSGSNCAHVTVRVDPRTGWVVALCCPRQPGQGRVGPGRPVRQPGPRSPRGHRPAGGRGLPVSITTPKGFVAAGLASGIKASRRPRPGPVGHR